MDRRTGGKKGCQENKGGKMSKKVCKSCKIFVSGEQCPVCKKNQFSTSFQGALSVLDPNKSDIAKIMGFKAKGEYAIKVR